MKTFEKRLVSLTVALLLVLPGAATAGGEPQGQTVWYVDHQASGADDGTSWEDAFKDLNLALDAAESGDEIWVAAGLYTPADSGSSFNLASGIALYGGFEGNEDEREARDWIANLDGTGSANVPQVVRLPNLNDDDFGDLRMQQDSPTIGQGSNALLPADEFDLDDDGNTTEPLPVDLDGNTRITNGTVDLGPYEFFFSYTVSASVVGGEGSIMPAEQIVAEGETASFTVTPDPS